RRRMLASLGPWLAAFFCVDGFRWALRCSATQRQLLLLGADARDLNSGAVKPAAVVAQAVGVDEDRAETKGGIGLCRALLIALGQRCVRVIVIAPSEALIARDDGGAVDEQRVRISA